MQLVSFVGFLMQGFLSTRNKYVLRIRQDEMTQVEERQIANEKKREFF
jgi:hypothetical protein